MTPLKKNNNTAPPMQPLAQAAPATAPAVNGAEKEAKAKEPTIVSKKPASFAQKVIAKQKATAAKNISYRPNVSSPLRAGITT
ncbi:hypothetical protein AC579_2540 [Pseudocercospora musae]|uniref:Uncharacterized protein n=1 Tax=Pseudocercospora musae TaxID=113226 RepID=A0A139I2V2_9PEZI|nr:hypothetical protein AC579_2540 [Pseudocercospora musae]KXT09038.1 hypothetical protein AC579_2540 [Pseudocercospora musae]